MDGDAGVIRPPKCPHFLFLAKTDWIPLMFFE